MRTIPIACTLVLLSLPLAEAAQAQGTAEQREACSGDAFRLCASSMPNADKVAACLGREREHLSPACRGVFEAAEGGGQKGADTAAKPSPDPAPKAAAKPEPAPSAETPRSAAGQPRSTTDGVTALHRSASARAASKPAARTQRVEGRSARKQDGAKQVSARSASVRRAAVRQAGDTPQRRRRPASDFAQADYWMRRVTGVSIGALAGMMPRY